MIDGTLRGAVPVTKTQLVKTVEDDGPRRPAPASSEKSLPHPFASSAKTGNGLVAALKGGRPPSSPRIDEAPASAAKASRHLAVPEVDEQPSPASSGGFSPKATQRVAMDVPEAARSPFMVQTGRIPVADLEQLVKQTAPGPESAKQGHSKSLTKTHSRLKSQPESESVDLAADGTKR